MDSTDVLEYLKCYTRPNPTNPPVPVIHPEFDEEGNYNGTSMVIVVYTGEYIPNGFFSNSKYGTVVYLAGISNLGNDRWRDKTVDIIQQQHFEKYVVVVVPTPRNRKIDGWDTTSSMKLDISL
jgi:hypothetical protein